MIVLIQFRQAAKVEWETSNPVLAAGEPGYDSTTKAFKVGDGVKTWASLPYQAADPAIFTKAVADAQAASASAVAASDQAQAAAATSTAIALAGPVLPLYATVERPAAVNNKGKMVFDTDLDKPIVSNGTRWEDMAGNPA